MSTPLEDLSTGGGSGNGVPPADEERVRRILAEMNADGSGSGSGGSPRILTEPPLSVSTGQLRMDPSTARANVIGNSTPTMADFQSMLHQTQGGAPGAGFGSTAPYQPFRTEEHVSVPTAKVTPPSWKASIATYLRGPVAVAIIVFLLNLPVVTAILSRYASWMYLSSGEISVGGLLVKAVLAASLFAVYQGANAIYQGGTS